MPTPCGQQNSPCLKITSMQRNEVKKCRLYTSEQMSDYCTIAWIAPSEWRLAACVICHNELCLCLATGPKTKQRTRMKWTEITSWLNTHIHYTDRQREQLFIKLPNQPCMSLGYSASKVDTIPSFWCFYWGRNADIYRLISNGQRFRCVVTSEKTRLDATWQLIRTIACIA